MTVKMYLCLKSVDPIDSCILHLRPHSLDVAAWRTRLIDSEVFKLRWRRLFPVVHGSSYGCLPPVYLGDDLKAMDRCYDQPSCCALGLIISNLSECQSMRMQCWSRAAAADSHVTRI